MQPDAVETKVEELLPWHRPELQRLHVSLDTSLGGGSATDGVAQNPGSLQSD